MSLQTTLTGSGHGLEVDVHKATSPDTNKVGLVAYTEALVTRAFFDTPLQSDDGIDMNIDPTVAGTTTLIHNGTDTVAWTASAATGSWSFNSTAQAYDGTRSVDGTSANDNDTAVFTPASAYNVTAVNEVSIWVYISKWTTNGTKEVNLAFRNAGVVVGNTVPLSLYTDITNTGQWQRAVIPFSAFGVNSTTVDDFTIAIAASGGPAPDVYFDKIELSTGTSLREFLIKPNLEDTWEIHSFRMSFVTTGTAVDWNNFFGAGLLPNGILLQAIRKEASTAFVAMDFADLSGIPNATITTTQGTSNTVVNIDISFPDRSFFLHGRESDVLKITVRDDLSALPFARTNVRGSILTLT